MLSERFRPTASTNSFRQSRVNFTKRIIQDILASQDHCSIIDVGGVPEYWSRFAPQIVADRRVSFTVVNLSFKGSDDHGGRFILKEGDARDLRVYGDRQFDLAHSNSVIEHVGRWSDMANMASETCRVGRIHLVQTPYWGFPVEPHNRTVGFHWLPEQVRYRLVLRFKLGFWARATSVDEAMRAVQSNALLDRRQFEALFPASFIYAERVLGLTKSLTAVGGDGHVVGNSSRRRRLE
jgi:hypothetical protein